MDLNNNKRVCEKEKTLRKSLNNKIMELENEKDGELSKVKKKSEATKGYLAMTVMTNNETNSIEIEMLWSF